MPSPFLRYAAIASVFILSSCALVPGMNMGREANEARSQSGDASQSSAIALPDGSVVNFVPLDSATLAGLPQPVQPVGKASEKAVQNYEYHIGPGDILRVTVWNHPELNNPGIGSLTTGTGTSAADIAVASGSNDPLGRVVSRDGKIYFPYVGTLYVEGMTTDQVRQLLTTRLATSVRDPQLDVSITTYRSQRAYVSGEVLKPGNATLSDIPTTVAELIGAAGGLTANADYYGATITRGGRQIPVDLYALLHDGKQDQNYLIHPGDILNVPDNRYKKVFVLGEVIKPSSLVIPKGRYSMAEALSDVGGLSQITSRASHVYVVRRQSDGLINAYVLDSRLPTAMVIADQFNLEPRDVIFVDPAAVSQFSRVITQIAPFLTGANSAANTANIARQ